MLAKKCIQDMLGSGKAMRRTLAAAIIFEAVTLTGSAAGDPPPMAGVPHGMLVAQSALASVPSTVTSAAREYVSECEGIGALPTPSSRFIRAVDLNDDSNTDYIIDTSELNVSCFCGSGGCAIEAWVWERDGYVKAFESNVRGWQLSPKDNLPPVLIVDLHGTACGGVGVDLCLKALIYRDGELIDTTAGH